MNAPLPSGALNEAAPVSRERLNPQGEPPPRHAVNLVDKGKVGTYIQISSDGEVYAINGHVDLGTGVRTAFAQIVAEELDVPLHRVHMVLGDTDRTPDQGPTTASASIQSAAVPMRRAAAQARRALLQRAAEQWGCTVDALSVADGVVHGPAGQRAGYGALAQGQRFDLDIDAAVPLKPPDQYRLVGRSMPRVDIPAKVTGAPVYVHDLRVPGMLHARMVRPPYRGRDVGSMIGRSLIAVDRESVAQVPGLVAVVVKGDFVGVVARREEHAIQAARQLKVTWRTPPPLPDLNDPEAAVRANPSAERVLREVGDVDAALGASAGSTLEATYVWPYQMHGSIGPSCAVAEFRDGAVTVWSGTQNTHFLHADLMALLDLPAEAVRIVRLEASGCYGRNCADDAAAEAALLSRETGAPVRLQLMREEEHAWEPKGTTQVMDVRGAVTGDHTLAYAFTNRYPSNNAPVLALMQTGVLPPDPIVEHKGDRTAVPQYRCSDARIAVEDMAPIVRAAWMRGVSALPNVFSHESFIDELAFRHGEDPLAFRLRFMEDTRARELSEAVAARAGWRPGQRPQPIGDPARPHVRRGRGFAQHQYVHGTFPGVGSAYCAWVCDVEVDTLSGAVRVAKVWVGYDCGQVINPAGVRHQIHGNVIQSVSRALMEQVGFDERGVVSQEWGAYPILRFADLPEIDVLVMPAQGRPPLGAGESGSVPSAAAIGNAIFNAVGVRLRTVPFSPARVRSALQAIR